MMRVLTRSLRRWAGAVTRSLARRLSVTLPAVMFAAISGSSRGERNSLKTLTDGYRDMDRTTLQTLTRVLQRAT